MPQRIWKHVAGSLYGYGNGYKATVYETQGFPEFDVMGAYRCGARGEK